MRTTLFSLVILCFSTAFGQNTTLFEISKPGSPYVSYLMGTIHISSTEAFNFNDSVYWAIQQTDSSAFELDFEEKYDYFHSMNSGIYGVLQDSAFYQRLNRFVAKDLIPAMRKNIDPEELADKLFTAGNEFQKSKEEASNMEIARGKFLDEYLQTYARQLDKGIIGIEGHVEQLNAFQKAFTYTDFEGTTPQIIKWMKQDDLDISPIIQQFDVGAELIKLYGNHNLNTICGTIYDSDMYNNKLFSNFFTVMIVDRNNLMAERTLPRLQNGSYFIAVGTAHLCGSTGLIKLYENAGYTVRPMNISGSSTIDTWQEYKTDDFTVDVCDTMSDMDEVYHALSYKINLPHERYHSNKTLTPLGALSFSITISDQSQNDEAYNEVEEGEGIDFLEQFENTDFLDVPEGETLLEADGPYEQEYSGEEQYDTDEEYMGEGMDDHADSHISTVPIEEIKEEPQPDYSQPIENPVDLDEVITNAKDAGNLIIDTLDNGVIKYYSIPDTATYVSPYTANNNERLELSDEEYNPSKSKQQHFEEMLKPKDLAYYERFKLAFESRKQEAQDSIRAHYSRPSIIKRRYGLADTVYHIHKNDTLEIVYYDWSYRASATCQFTNGDILYSLSIEGDPSAVKSEEVLRFFTSFKILK